MNRWQRIANRPFFIRLLHWEYWSFSAVYVPIYFIWVFLCLRARSFFFFAAANPRIENGGFLNESKKDIAALVPEALQPRTIFFESRDTPEFVMAELRAKGLSFPLMGKPNVGGRGRGVEKLHNEREAIAYCERASMDFHLQQFVPYPLEVGIFYYRFPTENTGHISGIVRKEFLTVTGDGVNTVERLLRQYQRGILQVSALQRQQPALLLTVPVAGESVIISPYGNHARGAKFLDDAARITPRLEQAIDNVCRQIPDFYFGRLDVRYSSWSQLEGGEAFSIIEVNGAGSEPTHMYDPVHSLFFAWKEIIRHWVLLWKISRQNHRLGHRYLTLAQGIEMFRKNQRLSTQLDKMSSN